MNYWGNYPKFFVSMMKAFFGDKATAENSWGFDLLPKWDKGYDVLQYFEMMNQGKVNGYICRALTRSRHSRIKQGRGFTVQTEIPRSPSTRSTPKRPPSGRTTVSRTMLTRRKSRPKYSVCRPPASPKRTVLSLTPVAGCSGTGKARMPRGLPLPMVKSSPVSSCACARCMPSKVARTRNRC